VSPDGKTDPCWKPEKSAAVTICSMVKSAAWTTGVLPSTPLVTVQLPPLIAVTRIFSEGSATSAMWNSPFPEVRDEGNPVGEVIVQFSTVPDAGASPPPELTVPVVLLKNDVNATTRS
jgi:hypothetical protein